MTPANMLELIRYNTRTNSTTLPSTDVVILLRPVLDNMAGRILEIDENYFLEPYTTNLVASSTSRFYALPADTLNRIKKVEAKFDSTNWVVLKPINIADHDKPSSETDIVNYFSNLEEGCRYEIRSQGIFIFSGTITAVTSGLKIMLNAYPEAVTDLTSTTDLATFTETTHGIPRALHELICREVQIMWKSSREKPIPLSERELKFETDLKRAIDSLRFAAMDAEITGNLPDAKHRGNNGFNY